MLINLANILIEMIITLNKYLQISDLDQNDFEYESNLIQICFDLSSLDIDEMDVDEFQSKIKKIDKSLGIRKIAKDSKWKENSLIFNLTNITFGQYVDMENYLKDNKPNEFLKTFFKLKDIDFYDAPISIFFNAYDEFKSFQDTIFESYSALFGTNDEEIIDDDDDEVLISPKKRFEDGQNKIKQENERKWSWFSIAFNLAKRDITKLDDVFDQNFVKVLNILLMIKDLQIDLNPQPYYPM